MNQFELPGRVMAAGVIAIAAYSVFALKNETQQNENRLRITTAPYVNHQQLSNLDMGMDKGSILTTQHYSTFYPQGGVKLPQAQALKPDEATQGVRLPRTDLRVAFLFGAALIIWYSDKK